MSTLPGPVTPQTALPASSNRSELPPSDAVITRITQQDPTKTTAHYLAHRLQAVFNDLGLLSHVPSDWLQPSPGGLSFRPLSVREADQLTLAVEDLAYGYRLRRPSPGTHQVPLF